HRRAYALLKQDEESHEEKSRKQCRKYARGPPSHCSLEESVHQSREAEGRGSRTEPVDILTIGTAGLRYIPESNQNHHNGERQIDEEDPMPGGVFNKPASKNRAKRHRYCGEA